jgi:hypothetical protein
MSAQPTLISTVRDVAIKIQNADGTALKSLGVAAPPLARASRRCTSRATTRRRRLQIYKTIGGVDYLLGEIDVPIGAGPTARPTR